MSSHEAKPPPKTAAERQQARRQRLKDAEMVRVDVTAWLPRKVAQEAKEEAEKALKKYKVR